jgi:GTP-binding protein
MNRFAKVDTREPAAGEDLLGTVAIVGFPNVGKSTLVNRLTESRAAVVHETPGVTRDRKELVCEWNGKRFLLIDTGGVDIAGKDPITRSIAEQAKAAVAEADLVLFLTDARAGITPGDEELAQILQAAHKPVVLVANKIDDPDQDALAFEFHRLGLGDPFPLSAAHGNGTGDLLDSIVARLPGRGRPAVTEAAIRVAILGRPNVGKSSLLNALLGEDRVIVSDQPGTTRDAIDTVFRRGEREFVFIDTAGLRRKRRQRQGIDYYSELRTLDAADRADVALVLVDASEGLVDQDLAVADVARKANCSTIVVLSKWDIGQTKVEDVRPRVEHRLRQRPGIVTVSATSGRGVARLLDRVETQFDKHWRGSRPPSRTASSPSCARRARRRRATAAGSTCSTARRCARPRFFFVNDPSLRRRVRYWVENQLRDRFEPQGARSPSTSRRS